jgi:hypothetical protein
MMRKLARKWWFWVLAVPVILYIALVAYRIPAAAEKQRTDAAIAHIQSQRLTMAHVDGKHLPPPPDPVAANATIEGIDANANGIRDDVELEIFKRYPNDLKLRAAMLQYAMALHLYLTEVFNTETWKAAADKTARGSACISTIYPRTNLEDYFAKTERIIEEVESLIINTAGRTQQNDFLEKYTTSFGLQDVNVCDV